MKRFSDKVCSDGEKIKNLNAFKRRLEALLGTRMYAALLRGYLRTANRDVVKRVKKNRILKDVKNGRCFILGNGPSLKTQDLAILRDEDVFTCNYYCDFDRIGGAIPTAHFITDGRLLEGSTPPVLDALAQCRDRGVKRLFLGADLLRSAQKHNLEKQFDVYYLAQGAPMVNGKEYGIDNILPCFETVVHSEILAAIYMGYAEIYLLGCDCTGFATFAHAYQSGAATVSEGYGISLTEEAQRSIKRTLSRRPIEEELRAYAGLFDSYEQVLNYCVAHDVKLFNATEGGVLESVPRATLSFLAQD